LNRAAEREQPESSSRKLAGARAALESRAGENVLASFSLLVLTPHFAAFAGCLQETVAPNARAALVDTGSREWNQPRGGPTGSSSNDVAPIENAPVLAWKSAFRSIEGEPVAWGGIVYAVATVPDSRGRRLVAIDLKTGKPAAKPAVAPDGFTPSLAVWQGMVAMLGGSEITFFSQRGDQMVVREKKLTGAWPSAPCVYEGYLFACDGKGVLHAIEMQSMKEIGSIAAGFGQPAAAPGPKEGEVVFATAGCAGSAMLLERSLARGFGSKAFRLTDLGSEPGGLLDCEAPKLNAAYVASMDETQADGNRWFVYSPERILATNKIVCHSIMWGTHRLSPIDGQAAIRGTFACGFASDGALISFFTDGKHVQVIPEGKALPTGARPGPATLARGVLYLGNWAVELDGGRVLWCDPSIEAITPLLPVADGTIVFATAKGELVCMRDPKIAASEPLVARDAANKSSKNSPPARALAPGSGEGVVLADGRRIAGKVTEIDAQHVRVAPANGAAIELETSQLALVETAAGARLIGAEEPVFRAFCNVLREDWLAGLRTCFEDYRDDGFLDEAQRLLQSAREGGLDEARVAELARSLTGKTANRHDNADKQRAKIRADEEKLGERCSSAYVRASDWCRGHALPTAASALLGRAERLTPGSKSVREKALALVPRGFPDAQGPDAASRWMLLAEAILPVAGEVVPPDDADWRRARNAPWDQGAFAVRTANVLLFSREQDARIVGDCLRHGERTVRVLQALLTRPAGASAGPTHRLDVRLHKNRAEYLAELGEHAKAMEWTAGYYSSSENVARFYVPRDLKSASPLERGLEHVLIHELTHHYISDRWLGAATRAAGGNPLRGGFWVVEGFARFIEDQVAEIDRRGDRFDDDTVRSIDAACRVSEEGKLFALDRLLDLSQKKFAELGERELSIVQLRNTIARVPVSEKLVFYEEGGSLVFYLMNRAGAEKRAALIEYLRNWYAGRIAERSWESLGYASSSELELAFTSFLSEVAHR
jgi:outer membrane protein assembly factor BamB